MAVKANKQNMKTLRLFNAALSNVETTEGVPEVMSDLGYGPDTINEGKKLMEDARKAFATCVSNKDVRVHYYDAFALKKKELGEMYEDHRNRARLVYRNNRARARLLAVSGSMPQTYDLMMESIRKLYEEAAKDPAILEELASTNITREDIDAGLAKIEEVEAAWTEHLKYKGISQNATVNKDEAFVKLHSWMKGFYIAAKIGLKHEPQLLESLGKVVKN